MKKPTIDRRIKYTKAQLENAMVELLKSNHISKITVTSLCDIADINRSTFYSHYKDQYDLLERMSRDAVDNITLYLESFGGGGETPVSDTNLSILLDYAKSNAELFKAFLSENCDTVFQKDIMKLFHIIPMFFNIDANERTSEYLTGFMLAGCISILKRWLLEGMPESTQEMSEMILHVVNHGLGHFTKN